jgi:hypothetical protein
MFFEKFHGKFDVGCKDNRITNIMFFAGLIVTLMVVIGLLMYAFL